MLLCKLDELLLELLVFSLGFLTRSFPIINFLLHFLFNQFKFASPRCIFCEHTFHLLQVLALILKLSLLILNLLILFFGCSPNFLILCLKASNLVFKPGHLQDLLISLQNDFVQLAAVLLLTALIAAIPIELPECPSDSLLLILGDDLAQAVRHDEASREIGHLLYHVGCVADFENVHVLLEFGKCQLQLEALVGLIRDHGVLPESMLQGESPQLVCWNLLASG